MSEPNEDPYQAPNGYAPQPALRTAEETQDARLREIMQEHFDICMEAAMARERAPRLTTAELSPYEPPNGYALKEPR